MNSGFSVNEQCELKTNTTCLLCGYESGRVSNLKRHMKTMHEEAKKILSCCDIRFANKAEFRAHVRQLHRNGHQCPTCLRNFSRRALLRRHQSVHTGYKEFRCGLCAYASSHKSNLERHYKTHGNSLFGVGHKKKHSHKNCASEKSEYPDPDSTTTFTSQSELLKTSPVKSVKLSHSIDSILGTSKSKAQEVSPPSPKFHLTNQGSELDFLKPDSDYTNPSIQKQHIINHPFTQTNNNLVQSQDLRSRWITNSYQNQEIWNNMFSPNYYNPYYCYYPFLPRPTSTQTHQGSFFYAYFPYNVTPAP